ncbi:MAG TPA: hypothetical protein DCZ95_14390 [Verrucomicrobia bacterium]|nr:MAG: hypothetical protein A2X46_07185 [Lentisphaerae bacterium GWF2_57_35]HBA85273.1 hypothetical protein [Verrucomicrobiota bacterium]
MNSRIISGIIALAYIALGYFADGGETAFRIGMALILPMACIWFSDAMGSYTGVGLGKGAITSATPGCMVAFGGWLLLLLPVVGGLILYLLGIGEP